MKKMIFYGVIIIIILMYIGYYKTENDKIIENEYRVEKIIEHRYLYQNGKVIEMTKSIVKMKKDEK